MNLPFKFLILCIILLEYKLICAENMVVFLQGTSCAGKTSISQELQKMDNTWKIVDEDAIFFKECPLFWEKLFPNEFPIISKVIDHAHLVHAILRNQIFFITSATKSEKAEAYEAIEKIRNELLPFKIVFKEHMQMAIYNQINNYLQKGFNVIVDSTNTLATDKIEELSQTYKVFSVLAYIPLSTILERVLYRNNQAFIDNSFNNIRFFSDGFKKFLTLYNFTDNLTHEKNHCLDTITKQKLEDVLNTLNTLIEKTFHTDGPKEFSWKEFSKEELKQYKEEVLSKFSSNVCYIVPKTKFDIIINSSEQAPYQCAQIIYDILLHKT